MDIEKLTKLQIVLLTLLISFVTSIATGIVTVSLMQQAPPVVAQTVNRVIEHTIETVASTTPQGQSAATAVTQEKTVVVQESDLISQAVDQASPSLVQLFDSSDASTSLGLGVVIDQGSIIGDEGPIGQGADAIAVLPDGSEVRVFVTSRDDTTGLIDFTAATTTIDGKTPTWTPIAISSSQALLGQAVVDLSEQSVVRIAEGIITSIVPADSTSPQFIDTDVSPDSIMPGSPLIGTDGSLLGVSTDVSRASSPTAFVSALSLTAPSSQTTAK